MLELSLAAEVEWRAQIREFLATSLTAELESEMRGTTFGDRGPALQQFETDLAVRGWLSLAWPQEYGGQGRTIAELQALGDELAHAGAPALDLTVTSIAPCLIAFGSERNRSDWLPGIRDGHVRFAVGYSEPDAGTDLANLKTRAVLDGDEWVINGTKLWNTQANIATHEWVLARTEPDSLRHRGLSIIVVPIETPGLHISAVETWGSQRTNETTLTDVRVPSGNLIGERGKGWRYVMGALELERDAIANAGDLRRAMDELAEELRARGIADAASIERITMLQAEVLAVDLMCRHAARLADRGQPSAFLATKAKVKSSELRQVIADAALDLLGMTGLLRYPELDAPRSGMFERLYRFAPVQQFAGGTNDVLLDVIAQRELNMPSYGRSTNRSSRE